MNILLYNDLNTQSVKKVFDKVVKQLQNNDFAGAEVKKMQNTINNLSSRIEEILNSNDCTNPK